LHLAGDLVTIKREEAYHRFREAIFNRTFKPGQFLTQAEIVKQLNISLGPLRDAVKRLEWEELIFVVPQKGLQIALPNIKDIKEAFQLRVILEKEAVRCFTRSPSDSVLEKLESTTREIATKHPDLSRTDGILSSALDVDYSLHVTLINEMKNDQLSSFYQVVFDKVRIAWLATSYTQEIVQPVMEEHIKIIEAIKTGDPELAAQTMENHLHQSLRRIMGV
jgi:DNA-binding GntR family transcriptional regulator